MIDQPAPARPAVEMLLPGDFARRVLNDVRIRRKRRRNRNRVASAVVCGALLLGLTFALGHSSRAPASVTDSYLLQTQLDSNLDQLAQAAAPDQINDYLTPAAAAWSSPDVSDASVYATGDLD